MKRPGSVKMNKDKDAEFPPVPVAEKFDATITVWCAFHIDTEPKRIKLAETKLSEDMSIRDVEPGETLALVAAGLTPRDVSFKGLLDEHVEPYSAYYAHYPDGDITIEVERTIQVECEDD